MTDRPILFSGPMVRAILDGRKTQTRRALNPQPILDGDMWFWGDFAFCDKSFNVTANQEIARKIRFAPGDRLWMREAWAPISVRPIIETIESPMAVYREGDGRTDYGGPWKPSIHMPRWASRLTLIVESVKVERLAEISEEDAIAEGVVAGKTTFDYDIGQVEEDWFTIPGFEDPGTGISAVDMYAQLWNGINGAGAWEANPWVAAITFRAIHANIDSEEARHG